MVGRRLRGVLRSPEPEPHSELQSPVPTNSGRTPFWHPRPSPRSCCTRTARHPVLSVSGTDGARVGTPSSRVLLRGNCGSRLSGSPPHAGSENRGLISQSSHPRRNRISLVHRNTRALVPLRRGNQGPRLRQFEYHV